MKIVVLSLNGTSLLAPIGKNLSLPIWGELYVGACLNQKKFTSVVPAGMIFKVEWGNVHLVKWGTLSEFTISKHKKSGDLKDSFALNDILNSDPVNRMKTKLIEVDRVLGGVCYLVL